MTEEVTSMTSLEAPLWKARSESEVQLYLRISGIGSADADALVIKGRDYGDSWKKRGGVGAFMMLARKWDRIEEQVRRNGYDVFKCIATDGRSEGVLDDIRDLRRYLMLVEDEMTRDVYSEMVDRGMAPKQGEG